MKKLAEYARLRITVLIGLASIAISVIQYLLVYQDSASSQSRIIGFGLTIVMLIIITTLISIGVTGYKRGIVIDSRNKISLSRVQMIAWTLLFAAGLITSAFLSAGISGSWQNILDISIPAEIWILMGISTTSMVSAPALLATKDSEPVEPEILARKMQEQGYQHLEEMTDTLVRYKDPGDARWLDLFRGEEYGNATHVDLGRAQMTLFTIVVVLGYAAALAGMIGEASTAEFNFPLIDGNLLTMIGISHAGYLTNKAVSHTKTKSTED